VWRMAAGAALGGVWPLGAGLAGAGLVGEGLAGEGCAGSLLGPCGPAPGLWAGLGAAARAQSWAISSRVGRQA